MRPEVWVAGLPSTLGGADTELDHQIDLWSRHGVVTHLVKLPGTTTSEEIVRNCEQRGCVIHEFTPSVFRGRLVVAYCSAPFLDLLPRIHAEGRPSCVVWFNCMTWTFEKERSAHRDGLIDLFGFQSRHQRERLLAQLNPIRPVIELDGYRPYFNPENKLQALSISAKSDAYFGVGRVSRDDAAKFPADLWITYSKVVAPRPVKAFVLGYGENAHAKAGTPPAWLDWMTWPPQGIPVAALFQRIHALVHRTGGSGENWPRVILEAYATGTAVIAEAAHGSLEMVVDGESGFLCKSSDELAFRASQIAFDDDLRQQLTTRARAYLINDLASEHRCWQSWSRLL